MTDGRRWARLRPLEGQGWRDYQHKSVGVLRRGAWYRVVKDRSVWVVLEVANRELGIPSELLEFRSTSPRSFSVVAVAPDDPNPVRGTPADVGDPYAVCPEAQHRVRLNGHVSRLECPHCHAEFPIEWEPTC